MARQSTIAGRVRQTRVRGIEIANKARKLTCISRVTMAVVAIER